MDWYCSRLESKLRNKTFDKLELGMLYQEGNVEPILEVEAFIVMAWESIVCRTGIGISQSTIHTISHIGLVRSLNKTIFHNKN